MDNREKNDKLEDLLKRLYNDDELSDESYYIECFKEVYSDNFRHEYSRITKFLVGIGDSESADMLIEKIDIFEQEIEDANIKRNIDKLKDHITLENIRLSKLRDLAEANKKYSDLFEKFRKIEENIDKVEKDIDDKFKDNNTQSITILGIFSGIVMAFTGGLSFIASSLQNINVISKYRLIFVILLLAASIFNIIFMLIYVIGKLTNKYIGSKCNCNNEFIGCRDKDTKCSVVRYPLVIWVNVAIVFGLIATTSLYFIDKYNIPSLIKDTCNIGPIGIIIIFAIIVISILLLSWRVVKKLLLIECKYEESEGIFGSISKMLSGNKYKKKEQYKK